MSKDQGCQQNGLHGGQAWTRPDERPQANSNRKMAARLRARRARFTQNKKHEDAARGLKFTEPGSYKPGRA